MNKFDTIKCFTLLLSLILILPSWGQKVGSYDTNFVFQRDVRKISVYVPASYASNPKPMGVLVVLHGAGDNSEDFRDAMRNRLESTSYKNDYIIVAPDGGNNDDYRSFNIPYSDVEMIDIAYDMVKSNYQLDERKIFLGGFSYGGASAFSEISTGSIPFTGVIYWSPTFTFILQELADSLFGPNSIELEDPNFPYDYESMGSLPTCMSYGSIEISNSDDPELFQIAIDFILDKMDNPKTLYRELQGQGHIPGSAADLDIFITYLENNAVVGISEWNKREPSSITVYPNPILTDGIITVEGEKSIDKIIISNSSGQEIKTIAYITEGTTNVHVKAPHKPGIYYLASFHSDKELSRSKMVVR